MNQAKQAAGEQAMQSIQAGMTLGLGTGSTAYYFVEALGKAVQGGLAVQAIATSLRTEEQAQKWGIPLLSPAQVGFLDLTVDGADEIDGKLNLIKGGGGALYREKMIATLSRELLIIADASKRVEVLGSFLLPVEVVPFGHEITQLRLHARGAKTTLRQVEAGVPYRTDNGNLILDCDFGAISDPAKLHQDLKSLIGVVETGLFPGMASRVLLGHPDGRVEELLASTA